MKQKLPIIFKIFIAAIFLSYYGGATLFSHTHLLNGVEITHSHPYIPANNHSHSSNGFQLINALSNPLFIEPTAVVVLAQIFLIFTITAQVLTRHLSVSSHIHHLRGPPAIY